VRGKGAYLSGVRLQSTDDATTVKVRGGELLVTDGPFTESKEWIAGFAMLECADLDEAIEIASRNPMAFHGRLELRRRLDHAHELTTELRQRPRLHEQHRRVMAREVDGRAISIARRDVDHPVIAEPVVGDRDARGENLLEAEAQPERSPREVDDVDDAVHSGGEAKEPAELRGKREPEVALERIDRSAVQGRPKHDIDRIAVL
jgi:hypothetical protein